MASKRHTEQKIAWITGASSGIGANLARELVDRGWVVAVTARNAEGLAALQAECSAGHIHCYPGDVTDSIRMKNIVAQILTHLGRLDLAILNAGVLECDNAQNFNADTLRYVVNTNLCGVGNAADPVLAHFRDAGAGHLVFVASVASYVGLPDMVSYAASKAGVLSLAEGLAAGLQDTNIKIQVVNPGYVATPMIAGLDTGGEYVVPADVAARKIVRALKSRRFEITFPWKVSRFLRFAAMVPYSLYFRLMKG